MKRPNIFFILFDGLRADHLNCYGYDRLTSPNISNFAKENIIFERAYSQSDWTLSSVASIFTSLFPSQHGAYEKLTPNGFEYSTLNSKKKTIAEYLKEIGYTTIALGCTGFLKKEFNLNKGFDIYLENRTIEQIFGKGPRFKTNFNNLKTYLSRVKSPFFIYMHNWDTHEPFIDKSKFVQESNCKIAYLKTFLSYLLSGRFFKYKTFNLNYIYNRFLSTQKIKICKPDIQFIRLLYDSEIYYIDSIFKNFLEYLKKNNYYDDAIIIVTADHGNALFERNKLGHGDGTFTEEYIRVPLIIKFPKNNNLIHHSISEPVALIDIMPTILEYLDVSFSEVEGKSLLNLIKSKKRFNRIVYFENIGHRRYGIICNSYKLIASEIRSSYGVEYFIAYDNELKKNILKIRNFCKDQKIFFVIKNPNLIKNKEKVEINLSLKLENNQKDTVGFKIKIGKYIEYVNLTKKWQHMKIVLTKEKMFDNNIFDIIIMLNSHENISVDFCLLDLAFSFKGEIFYYYDFDIGFGFELYDMKSDPHECNNLFTKIKERTELIQQFLSFKDKMDTSTGTKLVKEEKIKKILRDLGYF